MDGHKEKMKPNAPRTRLDESRSEDANDLDEMNGLTDLNMAGDEMGDPDENPLAQQQDEEPLDDVLDLKNPIVAAEMSEDPVRLYLREIGLVKLLDSDSEFRLATMIEANRLAISFRRRPLRKGMTVECSVYHALIDEMLTSWERLVEDGERLGHDMPDFGLMLTEAQTLHAGWESDAPSYLRAFLDNGLWGTDELWNTVARKSYSVFLTLYLIPFKYAEWLLNHLTDIMIFPACGLCTVTFPLTKTCALNWMRRKSAPRMPTSHSSVRICDWSSALPNVIWDAALTSLT